MIDEIEVEAGEVNDLEHNEQADLEGDAFNTDWARGELEELGLDASKYNLDAGEDDESDGDQESDGDDTGEGQESAVLSAIKGLKLVHNDSPIELESEDQLKGLIQQGYDYTVKTQNLSTERKTWEAEKVQAETELTGAIEEFNKLSDDFSEQMQELQQWTHTIAQLKQESPDVFDEIQRAFEGTARQYKNPIVDQQIKAMNDRFSKVEADLKQRENKAIVDEFDREKQAMAPVEQTFKELGLSIDWEKVKTEWRDTGMPVKKVIGSLYFEDMAKAKASKAKVAQVKQKTAARSSGAAAKTRTGSVKTKPLDSLDTFGYLMNSFNNLTRG